MNDATSPWTAGVKRDAAEPRRLLVIANPFPPMQSAGTRRVERFLRRLPAEGWQPTVIAPRVAGPAPEPMTVPVYRTAALLPRQLQGGGRRVTPVNRFLFAPDQYVMWAGPAVATGRRLLSEQRFDALFSSSPRASVHLVAAELSRAFGLPWLADYRDPWLHYEYTRYPTALHRRVNATLESRVLRQASAVSAINAPILLDLLDREPRLSEHGYVIPNGFDRDEPVAAVELGPGCWYVHTGRLYGRLEQTEAFIAAFARLPAAANLLFVGGDEAALRPLAQRHGCSDRVHVRPFAPHAESLGYQRAADALVLIAGRQRETTTSKVFEYLLAERPLFAVAPHGSSLDELLGEVGGGCVADPDEPLAPALAAFHATLTEGVAPTPSPARVARYDVRRTTADLASVLDRLVGAPR